MALTGFGIHREGLILNFKQLSKKGLNEILAGGINRVYVGDNGLCAQSAK